MAEYRELRTVLSKDQRNVVEKLTNGGSSKATKFRRANILLFADESGGRECMKDVDIEGPPDCPKISLRKGL